MSHSPSEMTRTSTNILLSNLRRATRRCIQGHSSPFPPLSFYDKHLGDRTSLKHTRILPTLLTDIAGTVDIALQSIQDRGLHLPPVTEGSFCTQERRDSKSKHKIHDIDSLLAAYRNTTAEACLPVASTLVIHPDAPRWGKAFEWIKDPSVLPGGKCYAVEDASLMTVKMHF